MQTQKNDNNDSSNESDSSDESESSLESEASSDWKCNENASTDASSSEDFLVKRTTRRKAKMSSKACPVPEKVAPEKPRTMLRNILDTCEFKKKLAIPATPASEKR